MTMETEGVPFPSPTAGDSTADGGVRSVSNKEPAD